MHNVTISDAPATQEQAEPSQGQEQESMLSLLNAKSP